MRARLSLLLWVVVVAITWLVAERSAGDPWRSRVLLVLIALFAYAVGRMHEMSRRGGSLDLVDRLRAAGEDR